MHEAMNIYLPYICCSVSIIDHDIIPYVVSISAMAGVQLRFIARVVTLNAEKTRNPSNPPTIAAFLTVCVWTSDAILAETREYSISPVIFRAVECNQSLSTAPA